MFFLCSSSAGNASELPSGLGIHQARPLHWTDGKREYPPPSLALIRIFPSFTCTSRVRPVCLMYIS